MSSRISLFALAAVLALIVQSSSARGDVPDCDTPPIGGIVGDGSFEAGTPNPFWIEASSSSPTPICTSSSCGFAGANTGDAWAFFGGTAGTAEVGSLEQVVTLPWGVATLSFFLWAPEASGNSVDHVRVLLDGIEVFRADEAEVTYRDSYRLVEVDVSAFSDGGSHLLRVEGSTTGSPDNSDFFFDDVDIEVCTSVLSNPSIVIQGVTIAEGDAGLTAASFPVILSGPSRDPVSVDFATGDVTAVGGDDYDTASGTLTFLPGHRQEEISIFIRGDTLEEPSEAFTVTLSAPVNGTVDTPEAVGTIANDDLNIDFGDAPDSYKTLLASGGPRHSGAGTLRLGTLWDWEMDGAPSATAGGDGIDEDGVMFTTDIELNADSTGAHFTVTASGAGRVDAWIDFNGDGDFDDANEQILTNSMVFAGVNNESFTSFAAGAPGSTYARFRLSSAGALSSGGPTTDGEVEDYAVTIKPVDDLDLMNRVESTVRTFWACHSVSAGDLFSVVLGGEVTLHAGNFVELRNDFQVEDGAELAVVLGSVLGCP